MITAALRVRLPDDAWVATVSRSFPDATFRLLSGVRTGKTAVELGEIVADEPARVSEAVAAHPSVVDYQRLEATDERLLAKYETTDTELYAFLERSSLPPEFPVVVRGGWFELDFTGTREEFNRLRTGLEATDRPYELESLVEREETERLLTRRQREVLEAAVREGYFEVPRDCTLEDLASDLDADTSTISGVVRRAENRVLTWFLTGADERPCG